MNNFKLFLPSLTFILSLPFHAFCAETDTLISTLSIKDPDSLISPNRIFRFGFFTLENTTNRYLGVFYTVSEQTVLWIANKDKPLKDTSGTVSISDQGNLLLKNGRNETLWSTNTTTIAMDTTVQIQNSGNLVLRDNSTGNTIWESFSYPSNVFVPTMRMYHNIRTGYRVLLHSWKNSTNPEYGSFTAALQAERAQEIFVWNNGRPYWRSGPWNGQILIGMQDMYTPYLDRFRVVDKGSGLFYFTADESAFLMRISLNSSGSLAQTLWNDQGKRWDVTTMSIQSECDVYGTCGPFGSCNAAESPICSCLRGFEPANAEEWERGNWTSGCVRRRQLECDRSNSSAGNEDGFLRLRFMKVPDSPELFRARVEEECWSRCLRNCSCIAYAYDPYIGCMFWRERLIDILRLSGVGPSLYVRLSRSELDDHKDKKLIIIISIVVAFVLLSICAFIAWYCVARRKGDRTKEQRANEVNQTFSSDSNAIILKDESGQIDINELPLFTFETLANATNEFHDDNMLGKGGFGPVYMGKLENGKEIAVKRLSAASVQGVEEFMNEVIVISKLQHRNLVRLFGCCIEREEKMLVYEYMPNKSLDLCLFDQTHPSQKILNWKKRFSIIEGIGRGLLYLLRDSRLRIIHRDLKPSNVLLDEDWNPKISDFGMARIFGVTQEQGNTARVVGTYGYMAPEYAMEGIFSEKSDVFSFGVLLLEIVSGKKITHYYNQEWSLSLLECAWKLWVEGNGMAFIDQMVANPDFQEEILRCIHIALLCVHESPKDRPGIQTVLSMLSREIVDLPMPEQPVFAQKWSRFHVDSTQLTSQKRYTINGLTITVLDGR